MPIGVYQHKHTPRQIVIPIGPSIAYVPLSQGQFAVVDVEDIPKIEHLPWCYARGYAVSMHAGKRLYMHRTVLGHHDVVDHRNECGTHNFKGNLRPATKLQNNVHRGNNSNNTSGYKGVSYRTDWSHRSKPWKAAIGVNRKQVTLGYFATAEEAHAAYCNAAKTLHDDFFHP